MSLKKLRAFFEIYPKEQAPFLHQQFLEWQQTKPLNGLSVLHHVPLVNNTLLKIACLVIGGAKVVVSNPSFMKAHPSAIAALQEDGIEYVSNLNELSNTTFDLYFDCNAELYRNLNKPRLGAIELTGSGDQFYRQHVKDFPVVSIDISLTKQLETVFGSAVSANQSLRILTKIMPAEKKWLVFGFGKIGRGLAYYCVKNQTAITIVDPDINARNAAKNLAISSIDPIDHTLLQDAILQSDIIVTATGKENIFGHYPKAWFQNKVLANMGVLDEYGDNFAETEILNHKLPINFILSDPTPIKFIDPELYAHNLAALDILNHKATNGVNNLASKLDQSIIKQWCQFHNTDTNEISRWFAKI